MKQGAPEQQRVDFVQPANTAPVIIQITNTQSTLNPMPGDVWRHTVCAKYKVQTARILSISHFALGSVSVFANVIALILDSDKYGKFSGIAYSGFGIWGPILWFIAGGFGLASYRHRTNNSISHFKLLNILSSLTIIILLPLSVSMTSSDNKSDSANAESTTAKWQTRFAMDIFLCMCCIANFVVSIVGATICFHATGCTSPSKRQFDAINHTAAQQVSVANPGNINPGAGHANPGVVNVVSPGIGTSSVIVVHTGHPSVQVAGNQTATGYTTAEATSGVNADYGDQSYEPLVLRDKTRNSAMPATAPPYTEEIAPPYTEEDPPLYDSINDAYELRESTVDSYEIRESTADSYEMRESKGYEQPVPIIPPRNKRYS